MAACLIRFEWINSKLVVMHDDIQSLSIKVSNGLTDRVVQVQEEVNSLKEDRARRDKMNNRVQLVVVGVMIALSTSLIMYGFRHYGNHSIKPPITKSP